MTSSRSVAMDVLNSFFSVVAFPLFENESSLNDDILMRSTPSSSGMHLAFHFRDLHQFWMMIEEPTKYDVTGSGMWAFALGNAMLW
eukprot:CAMPEP_0197185488 /NCGR_PEP_ID=MMETSP1423-20130617/12048_1 /TAXON_ID=476441 /ORGANISM="Pseudo-nitzschia heimii, Strain UNC1101" /LENGTH=85 /DNA_ID=CAMNT_0042636569 /DNA_START=61 /DNA_END=315 /DNA_ORIENTATION=+